MEIRILPGNIANMIAAGEVVQRPSSAVKELLENAVDAGANQITVAITDAGRTLIQVIDNGCGMSADDAVLCFERHATSKLATAEDLEKILTFGFRGEALASIAAVAEVSLKTRREEDEVGTKVDFAASKQVSIDQVSCPRGANFSVRNLFYNVPARRKYLKSDTVEFKHIVEEFTRVAITRPEIAFTLTHNSREVFVLRKAKSLKFRVQDVLGTAATSGLLDIDAQTPMLHISGFVGRPESAKKGLGSQFFFVNGRFFKSPYLHKAVMKAYENLVPEGLTPSYIIYLEMDPTMMDVNISPTKTEIKFVEDSIIFQTIFACVREVVGKFSLSDAIDFDSGEAPRMPVFGKKFEEFHQVSEPVVASDPTYNPFDNDGFGSEEDFLSKPFTTPSFKDYPSYVTKDDNYGKLFEDRVLPSKPMLILKGDYILTEGKTGMLVINIRRARERIMYERFLKAISKESHVTQASLFPEQVQVGVEGRLVFEENASLLESLGFDIRAFGNDTIVVNGVPEGFSAEPGKAEELAINILAILSDSPSSLGATFAATMAEKFARAAVSGEQKLTNPVEAQRLTDTLFACENAEFTASGRKIMVLIPFDEIERKF